jgi:hypothetical protein
MAGLDYLGVTTMPILTAPQILAAAQAFSQVMFVGPNATANLSLTQIQAGITAIDTVMSDTPSAFATAFSGSVNVGSAFGAAVAAAVPGSTSAQQGTMLIFWISQVTGIHVG